MEASSLDQLSEQIVLALLARIEPGSILLNIKLLPGSFSNHTHLVETLSANGNPFEIVVRHYKIFGDYSRSEKACREFKTFALLNKHEIPAPEPLLLDDSGEILGSPGIVTHFVEGNLIMDVPPDSIDWARKLASTLARIHSIPCRKREQEFLLKGNDQATWFLKYDTPPRYMQDYPGGAELWSLMRDLSSHLRADIPSLLHIDYWSGNILWHEAKNFSCTRLGGSCLWRPCRGRGLCAHEFGLDGRARRGR